MLPRASPERDAIPRSRSSGSVDIAASSATENGFFHRNKAGSANLWRPSSLVNLVNPIRKRGSAVFDSNPGPLSPTSLTISASGRDNTANSHRDYTTPRDLTKSEKREKIESSAKKLLGGTFHTSLSIVLVEAKGLPNSPTDGTSHGVYCKIRLGSHTVKSKTVQSLLQPVWRERFQLRLLKDHLLRVSMWDKGKQKTFMGSAVLDLSQLERERTHEIWKQLDDGYGVVHLSITICNIRRRKEVDTKETEEVQLGNKHAIFNPNTNWKLVGQLFVKVLAAKGLSGKPSAYCSLEVDNESVRTHSACGSAEPTWNKNFVFNVYDVMSTLDLKVYDSSLITSLHNESLGRISIPLLRVRNGEMKWYALKDKSNRSSAKGNCPRVLLEMSFLWNPVKASLRLFQPREVKYIKKAQKFDISLVYKNIEFVRDVFVFIVKINESYKRVFEWENQELSIAALSGWLLFWYHFKLWSAPLLLLTPFFYFWICNQHHQKSFMRGYGVIYAPDKDTKRVSDKVQKEKNLTDRIQELPEMTLTITNTVEYIGSLSEKLYNLASFKVPFLSYVTMILLIIASAGLYIIPFNYIMMGFGIYKFSRNYLRSEKIFNNDLEDFLSRLPDSEILDDWRELNVPEPAPANGINVTDQPYNVKGSVMY